MADPCCSTQIPYGVTFASWKIASSWISSTNESSPSSCHYPLLPSNCSLSHKNVISGPVLCNDISKFSSNVVALIALSYCVAAKRY